MRKGGCTVIFTNLNLSTSFHEDSATEIEGNSIRVWNQHYPYGLRFLGSWLLTERFIPGGGGGGDPGNPRAFVERRLQISSTQEQYFSRKATIVTALPPRIHWRRL